MWIAFVSDDSVRDLGFGFLITVVHKSGKATSISVYKSAVGVRTRGGVGEGIGPRPSFITLAMDHKL